MADNITETLRSAYRGKLLKAIGTFSVRFRHRRGPFEPDEKPPVFFVLDVWANAPGPNPMVQLRVIHINQGSRLRLNVRHNDMVNFLEVLEERKGSQNV